MTHLSELSRQATHFIEVSAKTPKQFAALQPLYQLDEAKIFAFDRDGNELLKRLTSYSFYPWEKNNEIKSYIESIGKVFWRHRNACVSWALPTVYINNQEENKKYVYVTILTRVNERFFLTDVLSTSNKFKCVGGPLTNTMQCQADAGNDYFMYNANSGGYSRDRPSAILVHVSMIGG